MATTLNSTNQIIQQIETSSGSEHIMSTNNNNHDNSSLHPPTSSSSSSYEKADDSGMVEIPPPPFLQRSVAEQLLPTTTTNEAAVGEEEQQQQLWQPPILLQSASTISAISIDGGEPSISFNNTAIDIGSSNGGVGGNNLHNSGGGGGGGVINVDNIFSAILDDTPPINNNNINKGVANNYISNNSIFHNFSGGGGVDSNNNINSSSSSNAPLSILIAPKKSSHLGGDHDIHNGNNHSSNYNVIPPYNPTTTTPQQQQQQPPASSHQQHHKRINSLGETSTRTLLSKSMGNTSFLLKNRPIITHSESNDQYDSGGYTNTTSGGGGGGGYNGGGRRNHHQLRTFYSGGGNSMTSGNNSGSNRVRTGSRDYITMNGGVGGGGGVQSIRHAGYLLKRSNLPYEMTTTTSVAASATAATATPIGENGGGSGVGGGEDEDAVPNELLLNSFSSGGGVEEPSSYTLPFGGVDSSTTSNTAIGYVPQSNVVDSPTNDYDDGDDYDENYEEDQCFCAPLVEFFTGRRRQRRKGNFHDEEHASGSKKKTSDFGSPIIDYSRDDRHHHPHRQQRHQGVVYSHQIPLKGPARSDPVPISPRGGGGGGGGEEQEQQPPHSNSDASSCSTNNSAAIESSSSGMAMINRNISRLISRSYSNGSRLNETTRTSTSPRSSSMKVTTTTTSSSTTTAKPNKKYPPPPPDYIDPRDGHIWRAKYCVLEEGILYFYRNAMEGESDEAQAERNESRNLHVGVGAATTTTTTNTTSPILPMMERLSSSPSLGSVPIPGATTATATTTSSTTTSLSKMGKKDLFDLSKSPMPMKKSDFFDLRVSSSSSAMNRPGATTTTPTTNTTPTPTLSRHSPRQSPILHHSNSTSTFHHDTDILWEKRVALDCVGAVRSSVQEHGDHAFELLAYGSPDDDNDDQNNDASSRNSGEYHHHQQQQQQIIDRLILRAGSSDDMNTWMFQFHRSLASYMQRIVNSALNNRHHGTNVMRMRPDSPVHQLHQHRRIGTPGGGGANNNAMNNNKHKIQQASSPMGSSFGSAYSPGIGPSLSHGHGRNAIYRRQVREHAGDLTPGGSPIAGPSIQMIVKSDSIDSQKKAVGMLGLRDVRTSPASAAAATTTATAKKYIPPHMRHAAPKKYVPPHIRRKMEEASKGGIESEIVTSPEKQIPLNDSIDDDTKDKAQTREDDGTESDTPSDSALSTTSSLLSRLIDDVSNVMSSSNVRRGGCADPTVIVGSILDDMFIPRKASVLENARLEPYGCIGGGFFTSMRYAPVEEEEDSIPFDDDMNNTGSRTFLSGLKWEVGASSECGVRDYNEDAYVVINNLDEMIESQGLTSFAKQDVGQTMQQGLFAIFDGHVGNQAARFSAEKFPELLMEEQSALASRDSAILSSIEDRTLEVLRNAFDRLDKEFCSLCTRDGRNWDCGSTALAALVVDDVVTLANLGDCRGVVCRVVSSGSAETTTDDEWQELDPEGEEDMLWDRANGAFSSGERMFWREVTETHSPLLSEEEERIRAANGWIIHETEIPTGQIHRMDIFDDDVVDILQRCFADRLGQHRSDPARSIQIARTCGDLAVSRAIGDRDFKAAYNLPRNTAHVVQTQTIVEKRTEIAMSWEGPPVFIYPHGHSGRFKGDLVSSVPDVKFFRIGEKGVLDEFLLMACDGLWDVMDGDDAVRIAKNLLFDKKLSAKDGAERLAELAKHLGSSDNITVILIRFYWEEIDKK